jgi:hypothetical protein
VAATGRVGITVLDLRLVALMRTRVSVRGALIALIAVELGILYVVMKDNSWAYDDNYFLVLAGQEGFTWHWLDSVQFEHWDIGEHVLISLQHRLFFVDYRWALGFLLVLLGGCMYLLERILATFVRMRWITLAFAAWFGLNITWAKPLQWWAVGMQTIPSTLFELLCLYGFMRYHADGRRRWLATSVVALAVALLFYEKPAYMLVYLVLLRILLMSDDLRPRAVLASFWRERTVWICYVTVIVVWGIGYINTNAYVSHGGLSLGQYLEFFRILWLQTITPSLIGVKIPAFHLNTAQIVLVVVAQIAVLGGVVISLRRKRSAWRAWAFLAITLLLNGVLVAQSRAPLYGLEVANDPRYFIDFAWLIPLAFCAAFAPGKTLKPVVPERAARLTVAPRGALVPVVIVLLLAYAAGATASTVRLQQIWAGPQAREWEQHVRGGISALEHAGVRPMVANNATPFEIMAEFSAPDNRFSRVLPMYVGPIQIDGPLDRTLVRINNNGTVHRAAFSPPFEGGTMFNLERTHKVSVGPGGRELQVGGSVCVIADGVPVTVERPLVRLPAAPVVPYYVRLAYHVWHPVDLPLLADVGAGYSEAPVEELELEPNAKASISWLGEGVPHSIKLVVPPLNTICIERFDIVSLHNAG